MKVNQIVKKQKLSRQESIRFQVVAWCSLRHLFLTESELEMLVLLTMCGRVELTKFCEKLISTELPNGPKVKKIAGKKVEYKFIFNSLQSARNAVSKAITMGVVKKIGKGHIKVEISDSMNIQSGNNLLLNYQFLCLETN